MDFIGNDTISSVRMQEGQTKKFIAWDTYISYLESLEQLIRKHKFKFDNIYGIPRGGLFIASYLAYRFDKPMIFQKKDITNETLVVDDIADSGTTLQSLINNTQKKFPCVTMFAVETSMIRPKAFVEKVENNEWIVFPYEE